eukprot:gene10573-2696_t
MSSDEEDLFYGSEDEKLIKWENVPKDPKIALEAKVKEFEISSSLPWTETFLVNSGALPEDIDPNDDFQREDAFYDVTLKAILRGQLLLKKYDVPIERPNDYFAEMLKTDDHMEKIRQTMLKDQAKLETAERNRKLRDMKKFGKKVQQEILQERQKKKKAAMQMANRHGKALSEAKGLDTFDVEALDQKSLHKVKGTRKNVGKNPRRLAKDSKFGFGGKKRGLKQNTGVSAADMSGFPGRKMKKLDGPKRNSQGKPNQKKNRPGKHTRNKIKNRPNK